ncbi:Fe-Mn family superoxide dismutase [Actinoplanes sichuanensis]|uniref:Fe-Mn family superoxide dismutase n=1 Tax=Actinoplanes sichuanensis TaxID=512349 RepID=A0ABW4A0Q1_9ACTN|nr:Fe-Mn family superoxide dismutase [Actinoplanes sichuanensis]
MRPPRQRRSGPKRILVLDTWERAYLLQYKNVRPDYGDRLWSWSTGRL